MKTIVTFDTHPHLGDNVICTAAVRNIRLSHPEFVFVHRNSEIVRNNEDFEQDAAPAKNVGKVAYGSLPDERAGRFGSLVEAYTRHLCKLIGIPIVPMPQKVPVVVLDDREIEESRKWNGKWLINANCQTCSISKAYPYWQDVVDLLPNVHFVQIGGNEQRDISPNLRRVEDMRGKTSVRDLFAMAYGCKGVISPSSAISNIAAAFGKRQIVLNASREPDVLTNYPNVVHVSHKCSCGFGVDNGCIHCRIGNGGGRNCAYYSIMHGMAYCKCQIETEPDFVAEKLRELDNE